MYFNKAAQVTRELNASVGNASRAALERENVLKGQATAWLDQALPHFQKAESLAPNDVNTLIALAEIYARRGNDLSAEFLRRLDTVRGGGSNAAPYFRM